MAALTNWVAFQGSSGKAVLGQASAFGVCHGTSQRPFGEDSAARSRLFLAIQKGGNGASYSAKHVMSFFILSTTGMRPAANNATVNL